METWKPKKDEKYWYFNLFGEVYWNIWLDDDEDRQLYKIGAAFETKDGAEFAIKRLEVIAELQRFADEHNEPLDWSDAMNEKWGISYNYEDKCMFPTCNTIFKSDKIYFSSEELCWKAIAEIGEDKIKKYYLKVA